MFLYGDAKYRRKVCNLIKTYRIPHFRLGCHDLRAQIGAHGMDRKPGADFGQSSGRIIRSFRRSS
jgi:hypothetical protein